VIFKGQDTHSTSISPVVKGQHQQQEGYWLAILHPNSISGRNINSLLECK
jgi:hypothetical protein